MTEVHIPADVDAALGEIQGVGELLQASEWKRAAIVWAFTKTGKPGPRRLGDVDESIQISISDFATLKIRGLRNRAEIRRHRKAWQLAIEHGLAADVKPGDTITLPDAEWDAYFNPKPRVPNVLPGYCTRCGAGTEPGTGEGICHSCEKETVSPFAVEGFLEAVEERHPAGTRDHAKGHAIAAAMTDASEPRIVRDASEQYQSEILRGVLTVADAHNNLVSLRNESKGSDIGSSCSGFDLEEKTFRKRLARVRQQVEELYSSLDNATDRAVHFSELRDEDIAKLAKKYQKKTEVCRERFAAAN